MKTFYDDDLSFYRQLNMKRSCAVEYSVVHAVCIGQKLSQRVGRVIIINTYDE